MNEEYREKIYGGWLGKVIGVIHGSNIEGWTQEEIQRTFGEITDLPFRFKNFCADDDINGPAFFQRALLDYGAKPDEEQLADTFLNYVSDGHGFFWWGGYGVSTEDTAYHNLVEGISPKLSGSARLNGRVMANQIGGQIFSDCWGLACPQDTGRAADLAARMASITHDEEAVNGARFVAAAIAAAFDAGSVDEILERALEQIPADSDYAVMVRDVRDYTLNHREDWRSCFAYVKEHYDYKFYQGVCHVIPNAAVIVLALLAGKGSFEDTINISAMCGWDTDCNEGNLGAILGVYCGVSGIRKDWIGQVHDLAICSGAVGSLNIQTVSQIAETTLRAMAVLESAAAGAGQEACESATAGTGQEACESAAEGTGQEACESAAAQADQAAERMWERILAKPEGQYMHFQFPESTHAIRVRNIPDYVSVIKNTDSRSYLGKRSLQITHPAFCNNNWFDIYYKPYYRPSDFDDNRYQPDLSPVIYPGDTAVIHYSFGEQEIGKSILAEAYYKNRLNDEKTVVWSRSLQIKDTEWNACSIELPGDSNQIIEEVGIRITIQNAAVREQKAAFQVYLGDVEILDCPDYRMEGSQIPTEVWTAVDTNPAGFSYLRGVAEVFEECISLSGSGKPCEMYTGNRNWKDYRVEAAMIPVCGPDHYLLARVQGGMRWYGAGLIRRDGASYAAILKKKREICVLKQIPYSWEEGCEYRISVVVEGEDIVLSVNGEEVLAFTDTENTYRDGCIGFGNQSASRTSYREYEVHGRR